jgi:hypothetical protein
LIGGSGQCSLSPKGQVYTHKPTPTQNKHTKTSISAATSAASPAVAIFDSKDDKKEVSDIDNDTSKNINNDDASNDNDTSNNSASNVDVFIMEAWDIMNQASRKIGTVAMEDRRFCSFFGAWKDIVEMVWDMLGEGGLHPKKSKPQHLL